MDHPPLWTQASSPRECPQEERVLTKRSGRQGAPEKESIIALPAASNLRTSTLESTLVNMPHSSRGSAYAAQMQPRPRRRHSTYGKDCPRIQRIQNWQRWGMSGAVGATGRPRREEAEEGSRVQRENTRQNFLLLSGMPSSYFYP